MPYVGVLFLPQMEQKSHQLFREVKWGNLELRERALCILDPPGARFQSVDNDESCARKRIDVLGSGTRKISGASYLCLIRLHSKGHDFLLKHRCRVDSENGECLILKSKNRRFTNRNNCTLPKYRRTSGSSSFQGIRRCKVGRRRCTSAGRRT